MELRQLSTFKHLAKTLSFSRTAEQLSYAQSTVSAQIRSLEEELEVNLFERLGKRVALTHEGRTFLAYVDQLLSLESEAKSAFQQNGPLRGKLRLYAPSTLCVYRLPHILQQFRAKHPRVQLSVQTIHAGSELDALRQGQFDFAFLLAALVTLPDMNVDALVKEPLGMFARPDHPLAGAANLTLANLQTEQLILSEPGCTYRVQIEKNASQQGIHFTDSVAFENTEAMKQCAIAGLGIAYMPQIVAQTALDQGALCRLEVAGAPTEMITQLVYHKDKWLSPTMSAFLDVVRETAVV